MNGAAHREPVPACAPKMNALARLPVFFALEGKRAVVAGGNSAAAWKAELLSAAGANVDVYTAEPCDEMRQIADHPPRGPVTIIGRAWTAGDVNTAALAIGAFETDSDAGEFAAAARAAGIPVNIIDKPAFCDFSFGSIVNRSPLVIGISTDGAAPVFAQAIRAKLEALLPQGFAHWAATAARWRAAVTASGLSSAGRRTFWRLFTARAMASPDRQPADAALKSLIAEVKGIGSAAERGSVALVGAGPGDPELLTLRAVRALQSADVILFDDLVSREVLDFARREAKTILVGKTGHGPSCKQDDINTLMVKLARGGKRVVRLKGGDPLIFARAGEEIAACRAAGIAVEIVPGITAAQGVASRLGVPLTDRKTAQRLLYVTGHDKSGALPADFDWPSLINPATTAAIYMPRKTLPALVKEAIERGLDPATPALAIVSATRPDEERFASCIADLPDLLAHAPSGKPVLVMLGRVFADYVVAQTATDANNQPLAAAVQ